MLSTYENSRETVETYHNGPFNRCSTPL